MRSQSFSLILSAVLVFFFISIKNNYPQSESGIAPYSENPSYWMYNGNLLLLLGGSSEDNLFQIEDLEEEIRTIINCGGNYVRNTLSSRDSGNVWAFHKDKTSGKFNLNMWNEEYWEKLDKFLRLTWQNSIIVQMELWATFDFYRENWDSNPFNPKNNVNYDHTRTKIDTIITTHPVFCDNRFFWSIPLLDNNMPVLEYQQRFIDKVLSLTLKYDNILYCIDNETSVTASWGRFWASYIKKIAAEEGKIIFVTEMWDPHDLNHISHRETFDHPEIYGFVEISQNNHKKGEEHWNNGLKQIKRLDSPELKRPVNNIKTYGSDKGRHGHGSQNGKESFVRNIFFGSASSRFHRPNSGLGISREAQMVIKSTRMLTDSMNFFQSAPGDHLLSGREENEAYCRFAESSEFAVFFTNGGNVELKLPKERYVLQWLDIENARWDFKEEILPEEKVILNAPSNAMWFALIKLKYPNIK